ncbi:MAG: phosphoribosylanthranilate isomerase [Tannerellaceae bacterium]|jgi:phosphoribosylanthranilate isomerase|nr:phosphoribosylanthranilate isomerase [Tannerellaceae bacterium]
MIIKVCGMRRIANILQVAALGVDWIGLIFYPGSKRYVNSEDGEALADLLQQATFRKVGVFVNAPARELKATADRYRLDYLQLHGKESPADCRRLRDEGHSLVKAFAIASEEDLRTTASFEGAADYFLFDTPSDAYGGSGRSFDWTILQAYDGATPFLLSGGIHPGSLDKVRRFRHPRFAGIDLNSGFESAPGLKDPALLAPFIHSLKTNN